MVMGLLYTMIQKSHNSIIQRYEMQYKIKRRAKNIYAKYKRFDCNKWKSLLYSKWIDCPIFMSGREKESYGPEGA